MGRCIRADFGPHLVDDQRGSGIFEGGWIKQLNVFAWTTVCSNSRPSQRQLDGKLLWNLCAPFALILSLSLSLSLLKMATWNWQNHSLFQLKLKIWRGEIIKCFRLSHTASCFTRTIKLLGSNLDNIESCLLAKRRGWGFETKHFKTKTAFPSFQRKCR